MRLVCFLLTGVCTLAQAQSDAAIAASEAAQRQARKQQEAKRYEAAEASFRLALKHWPRNPRALNNLAWMLLTADDAAARRPREALPLAKLAVACNPDDPGTLDTLATAHDALGQHLDAARVELRALRLAPKEAVFAKQLGAFARRGLAAKSGQRGELVALAARGELHLNPPRPRLAALLAEVDGTGETSALQHAVRALLLSRLGGREAELVVAANAALRAHSGEPGLARLQGDALVKLGRLPEAARALELAAQAAPADYELRVEAVRRYAQLPDSQGAVRVANAALADLDRLHPLWEGKWAVRLHGHVAKAHTGEVAALGTRDPAGARGHRLAAVTARARAVAARAASLKPEAALWRELQALEHSAAKLPLPARRHAIATSLLGQTDLSQWVDASDQLEARGGRRIAFADVDGDGDPDLLLNGTLLQLNDGRGRFRRAPKSGLKGGGRGGVFADYDRDGDLDLFVAGGGPDRLYRNDSRATRVHFTDVTAAVAEGLNDTHPSEGAAWGDVNGDGFPDLYVANYQLNAKQIDTGTPDRLWLSDGAGRFRAAHDLIQQTPLLCGRGVSPADFDQDGDLDLLVSNYRLDRNLLFVNRGGRLRERGRERGVAGLKQRGAYGHTIGSAWGDLDGDGDLDLVCANLAHPRFIEFSDPTFVYLQQPDGRFRDVREKVGIWFEETHSHPLLADLDNDGDLDLILTAVYGDRPSTTYRNRLVEDGVLRFEDVTWGTSTRVFNGWGAASADVDLDGDLDVAVAAQGGVRLWLNQGDGRDSRSVRLRLVGTRSDTWGAYATCTLVLSDGRRLTRQLTLGSGTTCQSEPLLHFGVGGDPGPFELQVRWPQGARSRLLLGHGLHTVREPAGVPPGAGPRWPGR